MSFYLHVSDSQIEHQSLVLERSVCRSMSARLVLFREISPCFEHSGQVIECPIQYSYI
jgi:hypothetical protein